MKNKTLDNLREAAADEAFCAYDFGDDTVTDANNWTKDGPYYSRFVYGDTKEGERFRCSFGIEFNQGTHRVIETWCQRA